MRFSDEKVKASRNFANKLWNAARFVLMNLPEELPSPACPAALTMADKWVLSQLQHAGEGGHGQPRQVRAGPRGAEGVRLHLGRVLRLVYRDRQAAPEAGEDAAEADSARQVLVSVLVQALKLLHPFMPFITEEIYTALPGASETHDAGEMARV